MKKFALLFVLMSFLSFSVPAEEGQIPIGGRTCPNNQTSCLVAPDNTETMELPVIKEITRIWKFIFG